MGNKHLPKEEWRQRIIDASFAIAEKDGFKAVTRDRVAEEAKCAAGQVHRIFNTMAQLKRALIRHAIKTLKDDESNGLMLDILAQGLASGESAAQSAPENLKKAALATLI